MSNPLRFLGLAVFAWAGVRAASLGFYPGSTAVAPPAAVAANLPPVAQTTFDPPPPPDPMPQQAYYPPQGYGQTYGYGTPPPYPPAYPYYPPMQRTVVVPASWPAGVSVPVQRGNREWAGLAPTNQSIFYLQQPQTEPWPQYSSPPASGGRKDGGPPTTVTPPPPGPPRFDRLQLTAWALLRGTGRGVIPARHSPTGARSAGARPGRGSHIDSIRRGRRVFGRVPRPAGCAGRRWPRASAGSRSDRSPSR